MDAHITRTNFFQHLRTHKAQFRVLRQREGAVSFGERGGDEPLHRAAFEADPELYALSALSERVREGQRSRVLFQLLRSSWNGVSEATRRTLWRVSALLLAALPMDRALTVFLGLRRERANHKHTSRAIAR